MSVSFIGDGAYTLDLNNGLASRLLRAMGYEVTEETSGSMSIFAAEAGILQAKKILAEDDLEYLTYLSELVQELKVTGRTELTWQ